MLLLASVDMDFERPGKVDLLLGVEVSLMSCCTAGGVELQSPRLHAFETRFKLVLAGSVADCASAQHALVHQVNTPSGDDILRKFRELEEKEPKSSPALSAEEHSVVQHFRDNHS